MTPQESRAVAKKRKSIDVIDQKILTLFAKRFGEVDTIAKIKIKYDLPLRQKKRWEELLQDRLVKAKKMALDAHFVESVMKLVHKESLAQQLKLKTKFLKK